MSHYQNTLQIIDGIYDIQPPAVPSFSLIEITVLILLISFLLFVICYFVWKIFFSKKAVAKREVKKVHTKYQTRDLSYHNAVYQLSEITKQGLNLKNINKESCLPVKLQPEKKQWLRFVENISGLRYKNNDEKNTNIDELSKDILYWLKVWP